MNEVLTQLGVGGIFAVLVIRSFVELVKAMKNGKNGGGLKSSDSQLIQDTKALSIDTNDKVKTLHSLHSKTNPDGLPVWYFPQSIVQDQKEIAKSQADTAMHMKSIAESMKTLEQKTRR